METVKEALACHKMLNQKLTSKGLPTQNYLRDATDMCVKHKLIHEPTITTAKDLNDKCVEGGRQALGTVD